MTVACDKVGPCYRSLEEIGANICMIIAIPCYDDYALRYHYTELYTVPVRFSLGIIGVDSIVTFNYPKEISLSSNCR